ncbi:polysaccharide deacetylase family protein [Longibacter salinarum]|uniref:Polysaccharide deacetylase family protein n=1 Tax=Longibacter salinarum TaxID=1850348 RepID=A0A2A8D2H1_9BACT|nr:polysaccharide deacetylase family protein [Longibacter salinarum]PEN15017.1 polysaccharide deacetylase family protein [Longibacter salinarum]
MLRESVPYVATYGLRPVQRFFPDMLWRMDARDGDNVAYLTFDDGPNATVTRELIDVLDRHEAHATFFLVGSNAADRPDLVRDLVAANHTVGNHTFTHPDAWTVTADTLRAELDRTTETIQQITGERVRVMRPPYGHPTSVMRRWCDAHRQRMVMWDVMPGDYLRTATERSIHDFVLQTIRPGSIIVLHDNPICESITPAALDSMLSVLRHDGWRFPAL